MLLPVSALIALAGCGKSAQTSQPEENQKTGEQKATEKQPQSYAKLLPADAIGYVRITNFKGIIDGFVDPDHLKGADAIRKRAYRLILEKLSSLTGPNDSLKIQPRSLFSFIGDLKAIHVGVIPAETPEGMPETVVFLEMLGRAGLELVHADLKAKLVTKKNVETVHVLDEPANAKVAFAYLSPTSVVVGNEAVIAKTLTRRKSGGKSLADNTWFQQAKKDHTPDRELFAYVSVDRLRKTWDSGDGFAMASHLGCSLGIKTGLTVRAYARTGASFPRFLVRTPREKAFLSRIPSEAAFLLSRGVAGEAGTQRNFVEWLLAELGQKEQGRSIIAGQWRKLAKAYSDDPKRVENEVFAIVEEIWLAAGPMKSESAMFIAPDANGRWGAGFLFDVADEKRVEALTKKVFAAGQRAKLPWKKLDHHGLTIHYIDFTDVAKSKGSPVPPEVLEHAQLRIGYAAGKDIFYAGTVEAIQFAHKPTGKTLDKVIDFTNVDEKNAIMISLLPGRVLHRTFGVPKVDNMLTRLAAQIPKDSNYTLTLNFAPRQLTFRTNIPFISLGAWAAVEFFGE